MATPDDDGALHVPLVSERAILSTEEVETSRVRVTTHVEERDELVRAALRRDDVVVERVEIGRVVQSAPTVRVEGDVLIYPVVEEVLFVEKRLVLKEELRITKRSLVETVENTVTLKE